MDGNLLVFQPPLILNGLMAQLDENRVKFWLGMRCYLLGEWRRDVVEESGRRDGLSFSVSSTAAAENEQAASEVTELKLPGCSDKISGAFEHWDSAPPTSCGSTSYTCLTRTCRNRLFV